MLVHNIVRMCTGSVQGEIVAWKVQNMAKAHFASLVQLSPVCPPPLHLPISCALVAYFRTLLLCGPFSPRLLEGALLGLFEGLLRTPSCQALRLEGPGDLLVPPATAADESVPPSPPCLFNTEKEGKRVVGRRWRYPSPARSTPPCAGSTHGPDYSALAVRWVAPSGAGGSVRDGKRMGGGGIRTRDLGGRAL